jgi:hypothetical protein
VAPVRPVPQPAERKLNSALITEDAELELEIPLADLEEPRLPMAPATARPMRVQLPAQAASPYHTPDKIEV